MKYFIFFSLLFISIWRYDWNGVTDFWWSKWTISLFIASLAIAYHIYKKYHWSAALAFLWTIITGLYTFSWYDNYAQYYKTDAILSIRLFTCYATFCFLLLTSAILFLKCHYKDLLNSYAILAVLNSVYILAQWINGNHYYHRGGFWGNGSNSASIIAFCYPLLFELKLKKIIKIPILIIPIVAIFCTNTSVPVGTVLVGIVVYLFFKIKSFKLKSALITLSIIGFLGSGYLIDKEKFFSSSHRFNLYRITIEENLRAGNLWLGQGPGSFHIWGPALQTKFKHDVGIWNIWLHSDIIQYWFEGGFPALFLYMLLAGFVIYHAIKKKRYALLSCFMAWIGCATFNFPTHYPIHSFFGLLLVASILLRSSYYAKRY